MQFGQGDFSVPFPGDDGEQTVCLILRASNSSPRRSTLFAPTEHALPADGARSSRRRSMYRRTSHSVRTARMLSVDASSGTSVGIKCVFLPYWPVCCGKQCLPFFSLPGIGGMVLVSCLCRADSDKASRCRQRCFSTENRKPCLATRYGRAGPGCAFSSSRSFFTSSSA